MPKTVVTNIHCSTNFFGNVDSVWSDTTSVPDSEDLKDLLSKIKRLEDKVEILSQERDSLIEIVRTYAGELQYKNTELYRSIKSLFDIQMNEISSILSK